MVSRNISSHQITVYLSGKISTLFKIWRKADFICAVMWFGKSLLKLICLELMCMLCSFMLNFKTLVKAYCNLLIFTLFIDINIKKQVENQIRGTPSFLNFKKFEKNLWVFLCAIKRLYLWNLSAGKQRKFCGHKNPISSSELYSHIQKI